MLEKAYGAKEVNSQLFPVAVGPRPSLNRKEQDIECLRRWRQAWTLRLAGCSDTSIARLLSNATTGVVGCIAAEESAPLKI